MITGAYLGSIIAFTVCDAINHGKILPVAFHSVNGVVRRGGLLIISFLFSFAELNRE